MTIDQLAERLQVLEDIEAIKRLKARYCAQCDDGYNPDGIASLFVEDGGVGRWRRVWQMRRPSRNQKVLHRRAKTAAVCAALCHEPGYRS